MNIETQELALSSHEKARIEYDPETDLLEIIFRNAEATCTVELTESMVLRFDWDTDEPLSLSVISFSKLLQHAEYGETYFQLLTDEWPEDAKNKIWTMLRTSPVKDVLKLSTYVPAHTHQTIPTTTLKQSKVILQAA